MPSENISAFAKAKELRNNIAVAANMFAANSLQVIRVNCGPLSQEGADLKVFVELSTTGRLTENVTVKIDLYDEDGVLFLTGGETIQAGFSGYKTLGIECVCDGLTLYKAVKGKLYAVLGG